MIITGVRIENYKSFFDSGEIEFMPGFNVVVGQNNVGKTALLEGIAIKFNGGLHRSLKTVPTPASRFNLDRKVTITLLFEQDEIIDIASRYDGFYFPNDPMMSTETRLAKFNTGVMEDLILSLTFAEKEFRLAHFVNIGGFSNSGTAIPITLDKEQKVFTSWPKHFGNNHLSDILLKTYQDRIYMFNSERLNLSEYTGDPVQILNPDASNLAQVLHWLSTNKDSRFRRFIALVGRVFPEIRHIDIPNIGGNRVKIRIWTIDPDTERDDLAMSLADCGTGIGQVLAMLYVVVNSDEPRIILIDEPQSFLHPGAIRKLIEILKEYPQHQYIMSSHSPTVVTEANPQKIIMVRKVEAESKVEVVDIQETQNLQLFLSEIGARLSDVFGADNILWVEGPTEEQCFRLIITQIIKKPLLGTILLNVKSTGDLEGKHAKTVFEIYQKLCEGRGILPPAVGFIFDREGRTETEREDLKRQSKNLVSFLERPMYENYLLNPEAIAAVLGSELAGEIDPNGVKDWLEKAQKDKDFLVKGVKLGEIPWIEQAHGAKLLDGIFKHFSGSTHRYEKIRHGIALTQWIIENSPQDLDEVVEIIQRHCFPSEPSKE